MSVITTFYVLHTLMIPAFLQNGKLGMELLNNFNIMSQFSGLKINKSKCEVAATGVMKDIFSKMVSIQSSCIRRLYDKNFPLWKIIIPLYLIQIHFSKSFKYYPNLDLRNFSLTIFPKYYQEIIFIWSKYLP